MSTPPGKTWVVCDRCSSLTDDRVVVWTTSRPTSILVPEINTCRPDCQAKCTLGSGGWQQLILHRFINAIVGPQGTSNFKPPVELCFSTKTARADDNYPNSTLSCAEEGLIMIISMISPGSGARQWRQRETNRRLEAVGGCWDEKMLCLLVVNISDSSPWLSRSPWFRPHV